MVSKEIQLSSREGFQSEVLGRAFTQKLASKKWLIARRAFMFLLGFTFYLVYSSM